MSSGLDHSRTAEAILGDHDTLGIRTLDDNTEYDLRVAEVHAQLAIAGSVAALVRTMQRVFEHDPNRARS